MRLILAITLCVLAAFYFSAGPVAPTPKNAFAAPERAGPQMDLLYVDVHFQYANGADLHLSEVSGTRACGNYSQLTSQANLRAQMLNTFSDYSGVVLVVVQKLPGHSRKNIIFRSGNILYDSYAQAARGFALIQAESCGMNGDLSSQANWLRVVDKIEQLQNTTDL